MRDHLAGLVLALVGTLCVSPFLLAQTADQPGTARAEVRLRRGTCLGFGYD